MRIGVEKGDYRARRPFGAEQREALVDTFRSVKSVACGAEFSELLARARVDLAQLQLTERELFQLMDVDSSGRVDKRDFLATLSYLFEPQLPAGERLRFLFDAYDADGNGQLDAGEVGEMLRAYGFPPPRSGPEATEAELREEVAAAQLLRALFEGFDANGSGGLDFGEFERALAAPKNAPLREQLMDGTAWLGAGAASPHAEQPPTPPSPSPVATPAAVPGSAASSAGAAGAGAGGAARRRGKGLLLAGSS